MQVNETCRKVVKPCVFPILLCSAGSKSIGSLKRPVRSHLGRLEMKNCTTLWRRTRFGNHNVKSTSGSDRFLILFAFCDVEKRWREAHVEVKMYRTLHARITFTSWDIEKVHVTVARSTFWSQNAQNITRSAHFWKFRCPKNARLWSRMAQNATRSAHFWKLRCRRKCTPMWREAHFEVKFAQSTARSAHFGSWDFEKVRAVVARHMCKSNVQTATRLVCFWKLRCRKKAHAVVGRSRFWSQNVEKHHRFRPLLEVEMLNRCTPLWHESHLEVKIIIKKNAFGPLLDVQPHLATLHHNSNISYYSYNYNNNKFYSYNYYHYLHTYNYNDNDNYNYTTTAITTATTTTLITLHYNYNHNDNYNYTTAETTLPYAAPHCIQQLCARRPLQPFQRTQLQPPVCPSVDSPCHPCLTTT